MLGTWYDAEFIKIETINPTVKRFWVRIPSVTTFDFKPGQFMTFDLPIHARKRKRWRSYSIASAPDGTNILEFIIVHLEGGAGTTYLFNEVNVGTPLRLRGPQGAFTLPKNLMQYPEICFICTGTGVAPFRSALLDMQQQQQAHPSIHLIFGTRYQEGILYRSEMEALAQQNSDFNYHVTLSREQSEHWKGHQGYVHQIYEQLYADKRDVVFYLCGWNVMLDEAQERLQAMGYGKGQIYLESYG